MIGFDRPLRPKWICDSLLLANPGQKLSELNRPFEDIAKELTGKEGKRKARTVLFRCFIRDEKNKAKVKTNLILKELSLDYGCDFMAPIYLFYLIGRTETLLRIADHIFRLYDFGSEVNLFFLKEKMVASLGDRDVVTRAVGAFVKTLEFFGVIHTEGEKLVLKKKLSVNEEQARIMLQLFAKEIIRAPQISLNHLPPALFAFFQMPNLKTVAQKYNGQYWDYQHRMKDDLLIMH